MRITRIDDMHADGGWRVFSFLKITTDEGITGWAEYNETQWNQGLTIVIRKLGERLIGEDPRAFARLDAVVSDVVRATPGGMNQQAIAALQNACLDIAAKAAGVPVHGLFGGPTREQIDLYWSHCGTFRARAPQLFEEVIGTPPLRTLDDVKLLGAEARARGFSAVKTNPILFSAAGPQMLNPGFVPLGLDLGHNCEPAVLRAICDQLEALRDGIGSTARVMLDVNFSFRPEGLHRVAKAVERFDLAWLEADVHDPPALARLRRAGCVPIASLEAVYGRRGYRPYFEQGSVDVAIVDVPWNGLLESVRIANMAEAFELNVAPHNFYGPLANVMSAHLCAAVPNVSIMEIELDDVPWKNALVTQPPDIVNGRWLLGRGPGWGTDIDEDAVRAHPPRNIGSSFWFAGTKQES